MADDEETTPQWAARWVAQGAMFAAGGVIVSSLLHIIFRPRPRLVLPRSDEEQDNEG